MIKYLYNMSWCGSVFIAWYSVSPFTLEIHIPQFSEILSYFIEEIFVFPSLSLRDFSWAGLLICLCFPSYFSQFFSFCFLSERIILLYFLIHLLNFHFYNSVYIFVYSLYFYFLELPVLLFIENLLLSSMGTSYKSFFPASLVFVSFK